MSSVSISIWTRLSWSHALNLNDGLVGRSFQHTVIAAAARMFEVHGATQRLAPEARGLVHIGSFAVDQNGAQAGMMHVSTSHHG